MPRKPTRPASKTPVVRDETPVEPETVEAPEAQEPEAEAPEAQAEVSADIEGPETAVVAGRTPPDGTLTTFNQSPPPAPEPEAAPKVAHEGRPGQYMVLRTANKGWVIEEKWQHFVSFEAIQSVIDAEVAAGRSGTLYRGNRIVSTWGDGIPARI